MQLFGNSLILPSFAFKLFWGVGAFSLELTLAYYRDNFWLLYRISCELWDFSFCPVGTETAPSPMWALSIVPSNSLDWFFHWPWVFPITCLCWLVLSWRLREKPLRLSGDLAHCSSLVSNTLPSPSPASSPHPGELPGSAGAIIGLTLFSISVLCCLISDVLKVVV